jgi:hypothetical protein
VAQPTLAPDSAVRAVVFVEGTSDQHALETLAARMRCDLERAGVAVLDMGGATNIWRYLELYRTQRPDVSVGGLCDANQEQAFRRALAQFGFGSNMSRHEMEAVGFFVCDADLEDELIRSLGVDRVLKIIEDERELQSFRTYQKQPAHSARTLEQQVHGFMWNRKFRYAQLFVEALDLNRVPHPLAGVLAHATSAQRRRSATDGAPSSSPRLGP